MAEKKAMAVTEKTVPELYWLPASSAEPLLRNYGLTPDPPSGEGPLVISQQPAPGTSVPAGTHVAFVLGTPRLVLWASSLTASINQQLTFHLELVPSPPQPAGTKTMAFVPSPLQPKYLLDWGDGDSSSLQAQTAPHKYSSSGKFNVAAIAEVGRYRISSNRITIAVTSPNPVSPAYRVGLEVVPGTVEIGQDVHATAFISPEPSRGAFYTFDWGDGSPTERSSPNATHRYMAPAGTRAVQAIVTIDDHDIRSNPIFVHIVGPPTTETNSGQNSNTVVAPQEEVAVPKLYWLTSADAGALLKKYRLRAEVSGQENGIVISQNQRPGTRVPPGTAVTITLGRPQLSLWAGGTVAKINEDLSFNLTLEPSPPQSLLIHYTFNWNDGTDVTSTDRPNGSHRFNNSKSYDIFATAQVGSLQILSNQLTVTIEGATPPEVSYKVGLQVSPSSAEVGQQIQATAFVSPSPTARVQYTFTWGDGSLPAVQPSDATHTYYSSPGTYLVQVMASINGRVLRSNPAQIQITPAAITTSDKNQGWSIWQIVAAVAIVIAVLAGGFSLFRSRPSKPSKQPQAHSPTKVSFNPGFESPIYTIQHAEHVRTKASLRIRAGSSLSSVSMKPVQVVAKRRSASDA